MNLPVKMDSVPKIKRSFDLYSVQLRTFLSRMNFWEVVYGTFARWDPTLHVSFITKDNIAREAIISGISVDDEEMISQEETSQVMWNPFVDKQTKREYLNYILAHAELYYNCFTMDKSMGQWLHEMESLRRQLIHYGKRVTDDDYAETILRHVTRTN